MTLRTGALSRELAQEDPGLLEMLLEDYRVAHRRDRCSRMDFAMGWLAAAKRLRLGSGGVPVEKVPTVPW